jgi:hypothetical protein
MKDIQFRIWIEEENCFHHYTLNNIEMYQDIFRKDLLRGGEVEMYSGFKDKNKNQIWESHILRWFNGEIAVVRRGIQDIDDNEANGSNTISGFYLELYSEGSGATRLHHMDYMQSSEILGDIHGDSHLLEGILVV